MVAWLDRLGGILLDASLATTALLSLVALAMLGCRQPVRRICLARAAILGSLGMIPLVALAPLPRVDIGGVVRSSSLGSHPLLAELPGLPASSGVSDTGAVDARAAGPPRIGLLHRLLGPPSRCLVVVYADGLALGLLWLVLGYWGLGWLTRHSEEASAASLELYRSLTFAGRRPRLRVSERVRRPVLVGLSQQTILIPAELDLPEARQSLRLSLLHELAHAERADSWFGLASSLCQAFWFFLPPVWWIRAQMRLDQEFMADRGAAQSFGPLQSYASSLVKIASPTLEGSPMPPGRRQASGGQASALFQRVLMLVQCPFPVESRPPRWWGWSLPGLVLLGTMAASSLSLRISPLPPRAVNSPTVQGPNSRSFRMAKLVIEPVEDGHTRSTFFELPVRLPESFDLTLELWGDRQSLSKTRVVGRRLVTSENAREADPLVEEWHVIRIKRDDVGLAIWVDQHRLPPDPFVGTTTWLSVDCPVERISHFRRLLLTW